LIHPTNQTFTKFVFCSSYANQGRGKGRRHANWTWERWVFWIDACYLFKRILVTFASLRAYNCYACVLFADRLSLLFFRFAMAKREYGQIPSRGKGRLCLILFYFVSLSWCGIEDAIHCRLCIPIFFGRLMRSWRTRRSTGKGRTRWIAAQSLGGRTQQHQHQSVFHTIEKRHSRHGRYTALA